MLPPQYLSKHILISFLKTCKEERLGEG